MSNALILLLPTALQTFQSSQLRKIKKRAFFPTTVVIDTPTLVERLEAVLLDLGEMHEHVLAAHVRGDEPKTLLGVEEFHASGLLSLRHGVWFFGM